MLTVVWLLVLALALPLPSGRCHGTHGEAVAKRFNLLDSGPCVSRCEARCGGMCFFNTRTFSHQCDCAFKRSFG